MATMAHISVSEYLRTTYRPDCDYIDGDVKERNVGEQPHGQYASYSERHFSMWTATRGRYSD